MEIIFTKSGLEKEMGSQKYYCLFFSDLEVVGNDGLN
jgi:hypothetical protein